MVVVIEVDVADTFPVAEVCLIRHEEAITELPLQCHMVAAMEHHHLVLGKLTRRFVKTRTNNM